MQMVGWPLAHLHLLGKQRRRACVTSPCTATVSALIDRSAGQFAAAILGTGRHTDERRAKRRTQLRIASVPYSIAPNAGVIEGFAGRNLSIGDQPRKTFAPSSTLPRAGVDFSIAEKTMGVGLTISGQRSVEEFCSQPAVVNASIPPASPPCSTQTDRQTSRFPWSFRRSASGIGAVEVPVLPTIDAGGINGTQQARRWARCFDHRPLKPQENRGRSPVSLPLWMPCPSS